MSFSNPKPDKTEEEQLVRDLQAGKSEVFDKLATLYQKKYML